MQVDPDSFDDNALISLILLGNEAALAELYERRVPLVFSIAHRITRDWSSAEEVTQDVFHEVWNNGCRYHPARGSVTDWLVGITRFRSIDMMRTRVYKAWMRDREIDTTLDTLPEPTQGIEEQLGSQEFIRNALDILPLVQRQVIELVCCLDFSYSEASTMLDIPFGTLKTRLRLGRHQLYAWFDANQEQYCS